MSEAPHLSGNGKQDSKSVISLKDAIRRARIEVAARSSSISDYNGADAARLEVLRAALADILAQIPSHIDIFDVALVTGTAPRLFIDMIGFIEMTPERPRDYCFYQDTRFGRVLITHSDKVETMVDAIRDYIARRLVERELALASDQTIEQAAQILAEQNVSPAASDANTETKIAKPRKYFWANLRLLLDFIGGIAVVLALFALASHYDLPWQHWIRSMLGGS